MKKWTYLVVAGLLAGATPMLQSCVDNDEPEGINVLRKAKAELIAAKKVVQEAEAARLKAEAAKIEAEAELVKAQAAIAKAQAEYKNAQTEADRARWEQEIANLKAAAEHQLKMWEIQEQTAQVEYQKALAALKTAMLNQAAEQQRILDPYIRELEAKVNTYNVKMKAVRKAQRDVLKATEQVEENEAYKELLTRNVTKRLADAQKELAWAQEDKAYFEALIDYLENDWEPSEIVQRRDQLREEVAAYDVELEKLQLQKEEKIAEMDADFQEKEALENAYNELMNTPITINEFVYTFPDFGIEYAQGEQQIYPEMQYLLSEVGNYWSNYDVAITRLQDYQHYLTHLAYDENGRAWTKEDIAVLKAQKTSLDKQVAAAKDLWTNAVAAYRTGTANGDLSKVAGYADFLNAVDTYNAAYAAKVAADDALAALEGEGRAIWEQYEADCGAADATVVAVEDSYNAQINAENASWDSYDRDFGADFNILYAKYVQAENNYNRLVASGTATAAEITAANTAMTNALTAVNNAWNAYQTAETQHNQKVAKLVADRDLAVEVARDAAEVTKAEAWKAALTALKAHYANYETEHATLLAAKTAADKAIEKAYKAADKLYAQIFNYALSEAHSFAEVAREAGAYIECELPENFAVLSKSAVEDCVRTRSNALYGRYYILSADRDRLIELTQADIDADIKCDFPELPIYEYADEYEFYGLFGQSLAKDMEIKAKEAVLAMTAEQFKAIIADFAAEEQAVTEAYTAAVAAADEAKAAWEAKTAEIDEQLKAIEDQIDEVLHKQEVANRLLYAYEIAASDELDGEHAGIILEIVSGYLVEVEDAIYNLETKIMKLEKKLAEWNDEAIDALEFAQVALEEAEIEAEIAKAALDAAQARYEQVLAAISEE